MNLKPKSGVAMLIGLVFGVSLGVGHGVFAEREGADNSLPLSELRVFSDVYARIKKDYVVQVDDDKLLEDAIRGMLSGLDPHSAYLDKEQFRELQIGTTGEFGGLGIEVGMEDGFIKVVSPIDDTPAANAGVEAGDLIIRLDDKPVKGMSLNDAVRLMRGKKGSDITLTIVREDVEKPLKITITRDVIRVKSVKSRTLEPGYGYVRITNFQSKTAHSVMEAVNKLKEANDGKLKGLVLDLRNNPGGVLTGAVGVSDAFLPEGSLIVYTEGRVKDSELRYTASEGDILKGAPMVVLINQGSASASEIVAGAMQDQERAIIMGKNSFGKGSVQTILPLKEDTALKLTTARYYTPDGRSIQAQGITPDIPLGNLKVAKAKQGNITPLTEASLAGHLKNNDIEAIKPDQSKQNQGNTKSENKNQDKQTQSELASSDYQLSEALNLLRGIYIMSKRGNTAGG